MMKKRYIPQSVGWGVVMVMVVIVGLVGCSWFERDGDDSPTGPVGSVVELGNYAQQAGQSRVVTVNGATHQMNGVVSGSVVAGGLYIEINEQSSVGSPAGTDQVPVSLQDVKITFTGLPSGVSAVLVRSGQGADSPADDELGSYEVTDGSVEIALTWAQWTQWFGPTHYAAVCVAVGEGRLKESMAAVSGRLPSGEVVTFGKGFGSVATGGGACPACPACPAGTCDPNGLPVFVDNGDGTVTDTRTGLVWLQDAGCLGNGDWSATAAAGSVQNIVQQFNAGTFTPACANYTNGTYTDWRLPTVKEIVSLMQYSASGWGMPANPFVNVGVWYWTADDARGPNAWSVFLTIGAVDDVNETGLHAAWAVR